MQYRMYYSISITLLKEQKHKSASSNVPAVVKTLLQFSSSTAKAEVLLLEENKCYFHCTHIQK